MPELPEVEVIRRGLAKKLVGETIVGLARATNACGGRPNRQRWPAWLAGKSPA